MYIYVIYVNVYRVTEKKKERNATHTRPYVQSSTIQPSQESQSNRSTVHLLIPTEEMSTLPIPLPKRKSNCFFFFVAFFLLIFGFLFFFFFLLDVM